MTPAERWREIAAAPDHDIDLAEAALVIAAHEYRDLDVADYQRRLAAMATGLRQRLPASASGHETILALNRHLFDELGFTGNAAEYYDPRNSYLNEVIERRLGIPITLAILYLEVGRRLGLALHGVSFPGHFLVKCATGGGTVVLDVYARGISLGLADLRERLRVMHGGAKEIPDDAVRRLLGAAGSKEILARVLRNLKGVYLDRRDPERALSACTRILLLDPRAAGEYRDRAGIYHDLECFRAALDDYERYLALHPGAADADAVHARVAELRQLAARLN
jgi:regulator of sirC expression with transglutaminase-like and TPR domain